MRGQDGERVVLAAVLVVLGGLLVGLAVSGGGDPWQVLIGIALSVVGVLVLRGGSRRGD